MKKLPKNILVTKSSSGNLKSVYVILVSLLLDKNLFLFDAACHKICIILSRYAVINYVENS